MEHRGTQTIYTKRLKLRRITYQDVEAMFYNWANDEEVTRYLNWEPHGDISVSWSIVDSWVKAYQSPACYQWGIELDGVLIGTIGGHNLFEQQQAIEVGYCMGRAWWGQGIMTEALGAVLDYFLDVGFKQINARHRIENQASGRVMQKCGMEYLGLRKADLIDSRGNRFDSIWYVMRV
jgi:ribosomal-protein-alanine N-acetyltransferase